MIEPIINPSTKKLLSSTIDNLPQSLLITGKTGVGLCTIAKHIANIRKITPVIILPEKNEKVDILNGVVSVDIMRRLYESTSTKHKSDRIIIIDYAQRMTTQAQNAFLKLLEEPGHNVHFILVSDSTAKLLPTVLSRVKKVEIQPITTKQTEQLLDTLKVTDPTKRSQLTFMADGLPAELTRLASDDEYFACTSVIIRDARDMLRGSTYKKLLVAQKYKDDRPGALLLLTNTMKILEKSISDNPTADNVSAIDKILHAYQRIHANGNIRLGLAALALN